MGRAAAIGDNICAYIFFRGSPLGTIALSHSTPQNSNALFHM